MGWAFFKKSETVNVIQPRNIDEFTSLKEVNKTLTGEVKNIELHINQLLIKGVKEKNSGQKEKNSGQNDNLQYVMKRRKLYKFYRSEAHNAQSVIEET